MSHPPANPYAHNVEEDVVLEARNITKRFPGVIANQNVNFKLRRGEILALLGENGAGKSTLMNIIYGLYHQDEGEVLIKGREVRFTNPREAIHSGIGMVHQHFQLIGVMDVAENVVLGEEKEAPTHRSLWMTFFTALMSIGVGYQLAKSDSILMGIYPNLGEIPSQTLIFDALAFVLMGILLPLLIVQWLCGKLKFEHNFETFFTIGTMLSAIWFGMSAPNDPVVVGVIGTVLVGAGLSLAGWYITRQHYGATSPYPRWALIGLAALIHGIIVLIARHSLEQAVEFFIPFMVMTILAASVAEVLTIGFEQVFGRWEQVTDGLRVVWGMAWRVGLIWVAIWLGGQAQRITQMGVITAILQTEPTTLTYTDISDRMGDDPLHKGGVTSSTSIEIPWRTIERSSTSFDGQMNALLLEIDEVFKQTETIEFDDENYRVSATVTRWSGLNGAWRTAAVETPAQMRDLVISLFLILFGVISLRSWRGWKQFPTVLEMADFVFMAGIAAVYLYWLYTTPTELGSALHMGLLVLGAAALGGIIYWTYRYRLTHQDKILPIFPLDTAIDSIANSTYAVASVRNTEKAAERVRELSRQYGLEVDPTAIVEKLPVGLQQRVEIVKALYRRADILILDEPTAVLTPQEGKELFRIMRDLAAQGVSIIFITHKLKEVFEVANSIVVMRGGQVVGTADPRTATENTLAAMMVGREVLLHVEKDEAHPTHPVLEVRDLHATDNRGAPALKGISFNVRAGEVLGVAGVQGNGQSELVEVLTGLRQLDTGGVTLLGEELRQTNPPHANPLHRLGAAGIDGLIVGGLALIIAAFIGYFRTETPLWQLFITTFALLDAVITITSWHKTNTSLGKALMGVALEQNDPNMTIQFRQFSIKLDYLLRYVLQTLMRYSLVGAIATFIQLDQDPEKQTWYDRALKLRSIKRSVITSRHIKDLQTSHVPEDRLRYGLVKPFTIAENLVLNDYYAPPYAEAPTPVQVVPLTGVYGVVFGVTFAALAYGWTRLWEGGLWSRILDFYGVPDLYSQVPTDRALNGSEAFYLNDPLMIALLSMVIGAAIFSVVAHLAAKLVSGAVRDDMMSRFSTKGGLVLSLDKTVYRANELIKEFDIRTPSALTEGGALSGGNQQKVVVAREFSRHPRLLIASQPTRGIDVGSIEFIHRQIIAQRDKGAAVLLVSAELDEILALSDRIAVMCQGAIVDIVPAATATREQLGLLMAGIKPE